MANRIFYDMQSTNAELKIICGEVRLEGGASPTILDGAGFTIARLSQSKYVVTFSSATSDVFPAMVSAFAQFDDISAPRDRIIRGCSSITGGLGQTLSFSFEVTDISGAPALSSDLTGAIVHFASLLRNTSVTR